MPWTEILTAIALVLVIEGMLPFIGPDKYRRLVLQMIQLSDSQLRTIGLTTMISGLLVLLIVRS